MADVAAIRKALASPLSETSLDALGAKYEGKVRDNYTTEDGRRFIVTTDRISAFDRVLGTLPLKGQVLQWVTAFWFERTKSLVPNHVLAVPDPNVMEVRECTPLGAEILYTLLPEWTGAPRETVLDPPLQKLVDTTRPGTR